MGGTVNEQDAHWLRPPLFRDDDAEHRQASWLELFFDLVFVVTIAGMAGMLREDLTYEGLAWFAFLFLPVWWLWMDYSYYGDLFDSDGAAHRAWVLLAMLGVLAISRIGPELKEGEQAWGTLVFAGMYAVLTIGYLRAHRANPRLRPLTARYAMTMAVSTAIYASAYLAPPPYRFWLWTLAVAVPMTNSVVVYWQLPDLPRQLSHMPERFGLFAIIALGESVVAVEEAISEVELTPLVVGGMFAGFLLAAGLWWVFFNRDDPSAMSDALDGDARAHLRSHAYGYAHYLVYAGIVAASVGAEEAILMLGGHEGEHPGNAARLTLAGGLAVALTGMAIVHRAAAKGLRTSVFALRLGLAAALIVAWALGTSAQNLLFGAAATLVLLVFVEMRLLPHPHSLPNEAGAA